MLMLQLYPPRLPRKWGTDAERVEGRASPKGNGGQTAAARTLRRDTASNGLAAVRRAARQRKTGRFTALLHHITTDLLKQSYLALTRDACTRDRWSDVASLRRKPRRETERPARANQVMLTGVTPGGESLRLRARRAPAPVTDRRVSAGTSPATITTSPRRAPAFSGDRLAVPIITDLRGTTNRQRPTPRSADIEA